jgi:hypothetical protein
VASRSLCSTSCTRPSANCSKPCAANGWSLAPLTQRRVVTMASTWPPCARHWASRKRWSSTASAATELFACVVRTMASATGAPPGLLARGAGGRAVGAVPDRHAAPWQRAGGAPPAASGAARSTTPAAIARHAVGPAGRQPDRLHARAHRAAWPAGEPCPLPPCTMAAPLGVGAADGPGAERARGPAWIAASRPSTGCSLGPGPGGGRVNRLPQAGAEARHVASLFPTACAWSTRWPRWMRCAKRHRRRTSSTWPAMRSSAATTPCSRPCTCATVPSPPSGCRAWRCAGHGGAQRLRNRPVRQGQATRWWAWCVPSWWPARHVSWPPCGRWTTRHRAVHGQRSMAPWVPVQPCARALQRAQATVMQQPPHPYYWAGFVLQGGW